MKKVKCGDCKHWDRENIKKIATQDGVTRDDIALCATAHGEPCFEYLNREIECMDFMQVEPEVFEVECVVNEVGGSLVMFGQIPKDETLPKNIEGKRTKLRIEVLD